ncbi:MAG: choice-of-anchor B family protein [Chitinophagales bacterium]|nr:choice-of-anchor B family protein [Chitinophagales bacterium]MDW8428258.1 choice-of-anchor B family protein [Chitinophagales bacterium]
MNTKQGVLLCLLLKSTFFCFGQNFNLTFRDQVTYPYTCASIWGYYTNGREYALVGTYEGISIVDVTDPDNAVVLFDVKHNGAFSFWREVKTWQHYAYATNEENNGLLIVDLQNLPNSIQQYQFIYQDANGKKQTTGHTLWIDEKGRLFVFGGNYAQGYTCFDLTADPLNPTYLGKYSQHYIHDGFVRGDTLWASEIYDGILRIMDVSNPAAPVVLADVPTPGAFTHNAWPTSDNRYVFTTDEVTNSYITAYDVSDLSNITEVDRAQAHPGTGSIVHNVHLYNDTFLVAAYYRDGVVIYDVSDPSNMVKVAEYDTYAGSGSGFNGTWGVYPWFPSGTIVASNIEDGLFVLTPQYIPAARLQGTVMDANSGAPLYNATVSILGASITETTDLSGFYKTGVAGSGTFTVEVWRSGYQTTTISNVVLSAGSTTVLNVALVPVATALVSGWVLDSVTNQPIASASVRLSGTAGTNYETTTDASGAFSVFALYDTYSIYAGKWGYREKGIYTYVADANSQPVTLLLRKGYYDDFVVDQGWLVSGGATTGKWVRTKPIGTYLFNVPYNPDKDIDGDWGDDCYVTGNNVSDPNSIGEDDVDNGIVNLTSPVMNLSNYGDPVIRFYAWFANGGGMSLPNDTLRVSLSDGTQMIHVLKIHANNFPMHQWNYHEIHVANYLNAWDNVTIRFQTSDLQSSGHVVEAGIDYFGVYDALAVGQQLTTSATVRIYPNPADRFCRIVSGPHQKIKSIRLYDLWGRRVAHVVCDHSQPALSIPLQGLSAGSYVLECETEEELVRHPLLICR